MKVKVNIVHLRGYSAPYKVIDINKSEKDPFGVAVKLVKASSRLANFKKWLFIPEYI